MTNKKNYIFLIFSFLFILIFSSKLNFVQAASYNDIGVKVDIDSSKSWTIRFNKELDKSTISNSMFIVTDENNEQVETNVVLGEDKKSVIVSPKDQYVYGKTYNLLIKDGIKPLEGLRLLKSSKMQFKIKSNPISSKGYIVTLDAGHGGNDNGNVGETGVKEKDIDLVVALKVGKILENSGVNVVYTRKSDSISWGKDNDLKARFDISNNAKSDFFVSIHCNAYPENSSSNGVETYYADSDVIGKELAQSIQEELAAKTGRVNRGTKVGLAQHEILRGTTASAAMVQLGFMTNAEESIILGTEDFQNKSASAIADGILESLDLVDKNKNITISSIKELSDSVIQGNSYTLPLSVSAVMSDGSSKKVNVIWDTKTVNTSEIGSYSYKGTVAGYSKGVNLTLTVRSKPDSTTPSDSSTSKVIVLDPGHGIGKDTGATGVTGVQEDDITLKVALKIGKILEENGVQVVYTRNTDERVSTPMTVVESLQRRCDTANNANARYFVSIHNNSFSSESAYGTETLYYTGNDDGEKLASAIQESIVSELGSYDRGLKDGSWLYIAKNSNVTTVLTELGFLSNPDEEQKLNSDEYQDKYAVAIAKAILQCLKN